MRNVGGGGDPSQIPSLTSAVTVVELKVFVNTSSGRPSRLKSATTRYDPVMAVVIGGPKLPSPAPNRTLPPPRARSSARSPLTSAAATEPPAAGKDRAVWKL